MKNSPTLRAGFYLFLSLLGMLIGSLLPLPLSSLSHLIAVLCAILIEKYCFASEGVARVACRACKDKPYLWLFFPVFAFLTLGGNLLASRVTVALGGTLPELSPSLSLFIGAVLVAPVAEELLFRGLILRLFKGFGEGWAILLSALLFALAHGALFQMPYALVAGLLLGYTAVLGSGLFYPLVFHFLYNLLAFFGDGISPLHLLFALGAAALLALIPLLGKRRLSLPRCNDAPSLRSLLPLALYGAVMLTFVFIKEFL